MMIASNFKLNLNLKPRANAGNLTLARRGPPGPGRAGPGLVGSPPPYPHTQATRRRAYITGMIMIQVQST